jgi:hypothetical protein
VQQGAGPLAAGIVDLGAGRLRPMRLRAQAVGPLGGEGADGIADALRGAAEALGDLRRPQAVGAGQEHLAAAQGEGVGGAEAGAQGGPLVIGQRSDEQGRVHPADDDEPPPNSQGHP